MIRILLLLASIACAQDPVKKDEVKVEDTADERIARIEDKVDQQIEEVAKLITALKQIAPEPTPLSPKDTGEPVAPFVGPPAPPPAPPKL